MKHEKIHVYNILKILGSIYKDCMKGMIDWNCNKISFLGLLCKDHKLGGLDFLNNI